MFTDGIGPLSISPKILSVDPKSPPLAGITATRKASLGFSSTFRCPPPWNIRPCQKLALDLEMNKRSRCSQSFYP